MTTLIPPPPRIDLCELSADRTGKLRAKISRPWLLYFEDVFDRLGGFSSLSLDDIQKAPAGIIEAELAALSNDIQGAKVDIEGQIAQLREQVAYMGLRRKRVVASSIVLGVGVASATYTISPAVASRDSCDLRFLGSTLGVGVADHSVAIELTNTTTVTAMRIATIGILTAYFELTEFTQ